MVVALSGHTETVLLLGTGLLSGCLFFGFGFVRCRQLVVNEVQSESVQDRVVIGRDPQKAAPFYVSNRRERALVGSLAWRAGLAVAGGSALALGGSPGVLVLFGILGRT